MRGPFPPCRLGRLPRGSKAAHLAAFSLPQCQTRSLCLSQVRYSESEHCSLARRPRLASGTRPSRSAVSQPVPRDRHSGFDHRSLDEASCQSLPRSGKAAHPSLPRSGEVPGSNRLQVATTGFSLPQDFSVSRYLTRLMLSLSTTFSAVFSLPQDFTVARYLTRLSLSLSTTFFAVFSLSQDCSVACYLTRLSLQRTPCCSQLPNSERLATCSTQHTNHNQKRTREPP